MKDFCVLYLCDRGLHQETLFSIASLAKHSSAPLHLHFLQVGYSDSLSDSFRSYVAEKGHRLTIRRFEATQDYSNHSTSSIGITPTALMRFEAIQALVDDYNWVHYTDGDTLFFKDPCFDRIRDFAEPIAACLDQSTTDAFWDPNFHQDCRASGVSPVYFNSGLMSINAAAWRETRYLDRFEALFCMPDKPCPYHPGRCERTDQCAANCLFTENWHPLPLSLNAQRCALHTTLWADATMRHYTTGRHKFLPILRRRCDPKEYRLLKELAPVCGLPTGLGFYDGGLSYRLNRLRRYRAVKVFDKLAAKTKPGASHRRDTNERELVSN